jgi:hypothetical protein
MLDGTRTVPFGNLTCFAMAATIGDFMEPLMGLRIHIRKAGEAHRPSG